MDERSKVGGDVQEVHDYTTGKLGRSEILLDATLAIAVVTWNEGPGVVDLVIGKGYGVREVHYPLAPGDAYRLGDALREHGKERGYDPDTGETKAWGSRQKTA